MCGIVGFTGNRQAAPILLDGLSKLEYRGYDSAGLAVRDGENLAQVVKAKGRLSNLYCSLRFCMACWHGRSVCVGRYGRHSGACGTCIGVPLSKDTGQSESSGDCCQPVW